MAPSRFSFCLLDNQLQHLPLSRQRQPCSTIWTSAFIFGWHIRSLFLSETRTPVVTRPDINSLTIGGRKGVFDKLFNMKDSQLSTPLISTPLSLRPNDPPVTGPNRAHHSELESRMPYEDSLAGMCLCGPRKEEKPSQWQQILGAYQIRGQHGQSSLARRSAQSSQQSQGASVHIMGRG